jgi:hypothetical protein
MAGTVLAQDGAGSLGANDATVSLANGVTLALGTLVNMAIPYSIPFNHTLMLGSGGGTVTCFDGSTTFNAPITGVGPLTLGPDTQFGVPNLQLQFS